MNIICAVGGHNFELVETTHDTETYVCKRCMIRKTRHGLSGGMQYTSSR
jgi:hypothetical protein